MASVDNRVVRMEFDNASFEKKLQTTLASLGHLNKAMKFEGATKGLKDVQATANKFNLGTVGTHIEGASKKFLALSTIAITALSGITTKALSAGATIAKSFSVGPIIDGFKEYETQLGSVQTILANTASKGTTITEVNDALQLLNEYSDKTIYNFGQMARNIGTFTAAGLDLNTSTEAIKGIANLAAFSGSTAEQASSAMYQLSQAMAAGKLTAQDWISVVNAGMGGEGFKTAIFEAAKATGSLTDVPVGQSFTEWTKAGGNFKASMSDGKFSAEALTLALKTFTGDMTKAELVAAGFSDEVADGFLKTAKIAVGAATEVKTFTQLIGTVKEAIGTGFADSFKLILGDFEEAKKLWTGVNDFIGKVVSQSATARNNMLGAWKFVGGRDLLINSLKKAFQNLFAVLKPIREAFRDIFPPLTAKRLVDMTNSFAKFVDKLKPSKELIDQLRRIFRGLFAALSIGWTVIKEGVKFIGGLVSAFAGVAGSPILNFLADLGDKLFELKKSLVDGGGIKDFFAGLTEAIQAPIDALKAFAALIGGIFNGFDEKAGDKVGESVGRIGDRFSGLKNVFGRIGNIFEPLFNAAEKVIGFLDRVWEEIAQWFSELGQKIADVMGEGDFDAALDAINVGLLGGIVVLLRKFVKNGFKFDFNSGFFDKIGKTFEQLNGVLSAMQANLKANALLKIAGAIAILTASVVVLSLIDSKALTKALTAMSIGFAQLLGSFAILTKLAVGPKGAIQFGIISAGLILLATSLLILAVAMKIFATMGWEEMAKGLAGVAGGLVAIAAGMKLMPSNLILVAPGLIAVGLGLLILGAAMKVFATMEWGEIGKGLATVAGLLVVIGAAMQGMPPSLPITAAGLILVGIALNIIAGALKVFATMEWGEIGKGLVAIAGALIIIGAAMQGMPPSLPITAAGLILVGIALVEIAGAMKLFASMEWNEIGRGLVAMAGALLILAIAANAMTGAILGAAAIYIVSAAMFVLFGVVKAFSMLSWGDLLKGLVGIAAALAVLGIAAALLTPVLPAMLGLGIALAAIGVGFALIGAGAILVAKAFEIVAKSGKEGVKAIYGIMEAIGKGASALGRGLARGIVDFALIIAKAAPVLMKALGALLDQLADTVIKLIPKIQKAFGLYIDAFIELVNEKAPLFIEAGLNLLISLLKGIRDNINEIVTLVSDIVIEILGALTEKVPEIVESYVKFLTEVLYQVAEELGRLIPNLTIGLAKAFITGFLEGLQEQTGPLGVWFVALPGKILGWLGDVASTLKEKGLSILGGFFGGILEKAFELAAWYVSLPGKILGWLGDVGGTLKDKGVDIIGGFLSGVTEKATEVITFFTDMPGKIKDALIGAFGGSGGALTFIKDTGADVINGFKDGLESIWESVTGWIDDQIDKLPGIVKKVLGIDSPSKVFRELGENVFQGFRLGMEDEYGNASQFMEKLDISKKLDVDQLKTKLQKSVQEIGNAFRDMDNLQPTITPVLDMTGVKAEAAKFGRYITTSELSPSVSLTQARAIASSTTQDANSTQENFPGGVSEIKFEQTINAPTKLSTAEIYKQTRNQITMAKDELEIL